MAPSSTERAVEYAETHLARTVERLKDLCRIPSVSADPPPNAALEQSAAAVKSWMEQIGLEHVSLLRHDDAHPYVYGDWLHAPEAPTALLYAHHDVQPAGRISHWTSPPFEPEERGGRLYGRGTADDKAGIAIHLAAVEAYLATSGRLPLNVRLLIDGEEEIGSRSLGQLLSSHREQLDADVLVLTDTTNIAAGIPSITYALRGHVVVDVEVSSLEHPVHSGVWGGCVPDPAMALCQILSRLVDHRGRLAIPELTEKVKPMSQPERDQIASLPYDEGQLRSEAGLLEEVDWAGEPGLAPYELMWRHPSVTISALEAAPLAGASNQILPAARARVGIRTVPDMKANDVAEVLQSVLHRDPPQSVKVTTRLKSAGDWWLTNPGGEPFEAGARALRRGFGVDAAFIACGGSISFVEHFAQALGGVPALLIGLEDPSCNAHSEDESLLLSDFAKAVYGATYLYEELGAWDPDRDTWQLSSIG